jgi:hypothetical protein
MAARAGEMPHMTAASLRREGSGRRRRTRAGFGWTRAWKNVGGEPPPSSNALPVRLDPRQQCDLTRRAPSLRPRDVRARACPPNEPAARGTDVPRAAHFVEDEHAHHTIRGAPGGANGAPAGPRLTCRVSSRPVLTARCAGQLPGELLRLCRKIPDGPSLLCPIRRSCPV